MMYYFRPSDQGLAAVASNNVITLNKVSSSLNTIILQGSQVANIWPEIRAKKAENIFKFSSFCT